MADGGMMSSGGAGYRIEPLNTLAFPKGAAPRCELTGLPASVQCVTPHITLYYATREHAEQAWHGIMHKISPLLAPLRAPSVVVGSEEDRAKRDYTLQMSKRALIDLCSQEASKFLVAGRCVVSVARRDTKHNHTLRPARPPRPPREGRRRERSENKTHARSTSGGEAAAGARWEARPP